MRTALRLLVTALLGLGAGLAAVVAGAAPAHACSCKQLTDSEALAGSDAVFTGRLLDRKDAPAAADGSMSSTDPATLTFAVDRVYKGDVLARQPVQTARMGASCGWELSGEGPYVVFASRQGTVLRISLCSGNRAGAVPAVWGSGTAPKAASGASGSPSSAPAPSPGSATAPAAGSGGAAATQTGFWDVGAPGVAVAAALVLAAGLLNLPRPLRDE
jgi:hypothetical protein